MKKSPRDDLGGTRCGCRMLPGAHARCIRGDGSSRRRGRSPLRQDYEVLFATRAVVVLDCWPEGRAIESRPHRVGRQMLETRECLY